MAKRSKSYGRQSAQTGMFEFVHHVQRHWVLRLLGGVIRLRAELTTLVVVLVVWRVLDVHVWPGTGAVIIVGVLLVGLIAVPRSRRFLRSRVWCVLTRHRVRSCLVSCRVMTHEGRLPRLLWCRPTPVGERLWLWLRPGLSARKVEQVADELAAACLSRDARVSVHEKRRMLVRVDIIRHDPLAASGVKSDLTTDLPDEAPGVVIALPDRATLTTPHSGTTAASATASTIASTTASPVTPTSTPSGRGADRARARAADTDSASSVRGVSGEDVSDYV